MRRSDQSDSMNLPHSPAYMEASAARAGLNAGLAVGVQGAQGAAAAVATIVLPLDRSLLCPPIRQVPDQKLKILFWLVSPSSGRGLKIKVEIKSFS
jgi:hypothetical protein